MSLLSQRLCHVLVVICALFLLPGHIRGAEERTYFVFPQGDVTVTTPQVRIIAQIGDGEEIEFSLTDGNGNESGTKSEPGVVFSQLITLTPGINLLTLQRGPTDQFDSRRIYYTADLEKDPPPAGFPRLFLHGKDDVTGSYCGTCHPVKGHAQKPDFKRLKPTPACSSAKCHDNFAKAKFIHGPAQKGSCISCHNPHGTINKGFVSRTKDQLCFACHTRLEKLWDLEFKHKPVLEGKCLACHDQHQANLKFQLKGDSVQDLCLSCHKKKKVTHLVEHEPVVSGQCLACHTPHASGFKGLLREDAGRICLKCHADMQKVIDQEYQHGPVKKYECTKCHAVHGSDFSFLLIDNFDDEFYGDFAIDRFKFCFKCHEQKVFTEPQNLKTNFRDKTRNLHFLHVNAKNRSSCKMCHEIHASSQAKIIRTRTSFIKKYKAALNYTQTATGGTCLAACHKQQQYDRGAPAQ